MHDIRVLVAEDEEVIRKSLVYKIRKILPGVLVYEAENGRQAQQLIYKEKPHIAVTDIRMPYLSGIELMESCFGQTNCKFIITSGYSDFKYAQRAIDLKAVSYLLKPIENKEFAKALQKAVSETDGLAMPFVAADTEAEYDAFSKNTIEVIIEKAKEYVEKNFNKELTLVELARKFNVSESYFSREFKIQTGISYSRFLTQKRVEQAKKLLAASDQSISEISQAIGYDDIQYFYRVFKKDVKLTPMEYRKKVKYLGEKREINTRENC